MATNSIDNYMPTTSVGGITSSTAIKGKGTEEMGMDDFFNLLVAQMTNQDMMNPTDNTEMIAQMAQFSTLQGMKTIQEYQQSSYAMSYVGKDVTIANVNESTGKIETISGTVDSITFYDGSPQVVVNGNAYPLYSVMEINSPNTSGNALNQVANYIGKTVTLTDTDSDGMPFDVTGVVGSVTLKGGKAYVLIGDKAYPASSITEVYPTVASESKPTDETTGGTTGDSDLDTDDSDIDVDVDAGDTDSDLDTDD